MSALSFRDAKTHTRVGYLCMWPDCRGSKRGMRAGRHRVAICGYPLLARDRTELRVCGQCKEALEELWAGARGSVRQEVAA